MHTWTDMTDDDELAIRGRTIVRVAAGVLLGLDVAVTMLYMARFGTRSLPQQVVRCVLTMVLALGLLSAKAWARWATVVVCALAMITAPPPVRAGSWTSGNLPGTLGVVFMFVCYGLIGRALLWSRSVRAFFRTGGRRSSAATTEA